jgi:hypothetical protein
MRVTPLEPSEISALAGKWAFSMSLLAFSVHIRQKVQHDLTKCICLFDIGEMKSGFQNDELGPTDLFMDGLCRRNRRARIIFARHNQGWKRDLPEPVRYI